MVTTTTQISQTDLDEALAEEFGLNADYVSELLAQFRTDPASIDSEWREYFEELTGTGQPRTDGAPRTGSPEKPVSASALQPEYNWAQPSTPAAEIRDAPAHRVAQPAPPAETPQPATGQPEGVPASTTEAQKSAAVRPTVPPAAPQGSPAAASPTPSTQPATDVAQEERLVLRGAALKIAENMSASISVPTATSQRQIPVKLLEENRRLINDHLKQTGRKVSFTHLIGHAIVKALRELPQLNHRFEEKNGEAFRVRPNGVNLGIAVDVTRKDGTRTLLVPNIKEANRLTFPELVDAYDDVVRRAREGKLQLADFQGTTISLTNPGTLGTTASNPRLMPGQGAIIASGAIEYPSAYEAMSAEALARLGVGKSMFITSTYDHRIVQGAESGAFLALIDELLRGEHRFYDEIFAELGIPFRPYRWSADRNPALLGEDRYRGEIRKQARVFELINAYRVRGHLVANIDPLGWKRVQYHKELDIETYDLTIWDLDRTFLTGGLGEDERPTLRRILELARRYYCGTVGVEYRHIQDPDEKEFIRTRVERPRPEIEASVRKQMLWKLISAELFEQFLGTKYIGQKRFSIEGNETVLALLDQLIDRAATRGVADITIGMAHRGRLNVIANVIGKFCERIFTSFEGSIHPDYPHDQGDVKYHQGASGVRETPEGQRVALTVASNPSHLEFVDPVVEGLVRAKQNAAGEFSSHLAVLLHGDAAFAGEGIVAETLNLSQLPGYFTGGTIHLIINNQLGFTTPPEEGRSSQYCTDIAKMIQAPIFHINSDDVEGGFNALQIALDYRQQFRKDVVLDVIGFRKLGHNEGDEPTYTQPVMYQRIKQNPGVRQRYSDKLVAEGVLSVEEAKSLMEERWRRYENAQLGAKEIVVKQGGQIAIDPPAKEPDSVEVVATGIDHETLRRIAQAIAQVPRGFNLNPKILGLLSRRAKMVEGSVPIDWGTAEALAFGSLLIEGTPVRLSGQDTVRGTFSHRHAAFVDTQTGQEWIPLGELARDRASFQIYDSPLSEAGALGFEYGYSVASPASLVLWEAQFGDFINAAQVIVDQFIASGEEKWNQASRIVLLLPHGYEGQGPEHSSARVERFLQLCANGNLQVCNATTSAQYFHLLRRQARLEHPVPLIIVTPKSLLRLADASSNVDRFTGGGFLPVIPDSSVDPAKVRRLLLCTGKIFFELASERNRLGDQTTAILRLEQLYPFPAKQISSELDRFPAAEIRWVQEEPRNYGAWPWLEPRLREVTAGTRLVTYAGRPPAASTATGSHTIHQMEQKRLIEEAFADAN